MEMQDADYVSVAGSLIKRTPGYLDRLRAMNDEQSEAVKDLEAAFVLSALQLKRVGTVEGLSKASQENLRSFLSASRGQAIRVIGEAHYISITRGAPAFVFTEVGDSKSSDLASEAESITASAAH